MFAILAPPKYLYIFLNKINFFSDFPCLFGQNKLDLS